MTNEQPKGKGQQDRSMVPIDMSTVTVGDLTGAIIASIPGAGRMSSDQVKGYAIATKVSGRNPFSREMYLIPGIGVTDAAKSTLSDFMEWHKDDDPSWDYVWNVPDEIRQQYGVGPDDLIVEVRLHLKSLRVAWREQGDALRGWGVPWQDIVAELGMVPPYYSAFGVVHFSEQKDDPTTGPNAPKEPKTAKQKWAEMDAKYSRPERAKKRGRTAIINAVAPVTTDQRMRVAEEHRARIADAKADPTKFVTAREEIVDRRPMTHAERAAALGRSDTDTILPEKHGDVVIDADGVIIPPAEQTDSAPAGESVDDDSADVPDFDQIPASAAPMTIPQELIDLKAAISAAATRYGGREPLSEKYRKFMFVLVNEACGKSEPKRKAVTGYLTGFPHFPDILDPYLRALKDCWLKPTDGPDGRAVLGKDAKRIADAIVKAVGVDQPSDMFEE